VLVVKDANVGLLLDKKAINVNDCRRHSTSDINKVEMCVNLPVKEAPQLKRQLGFDCGPTHCPHLTRVQRGLDANTVTAQAKIRGSWQLHIARGEAQPGSTCVVAVVVQSTREGMLQLPGSSWCSASRVIMACVNGDALMVAGCELRLGANCLHTTCHKLACDVNSRFLRTKQSFEGHDVIIISQNDTGRTKPVRKKRE
jgi:hypothetical protein